MEGRRTGAPNQLVRCVPVEPAAAWSPILVEPRNALEGGSRQAGWSSGSGGHSFRASRTIRRKSSSSFVEVRSFDDCVSDRAVDHLGREVVADHIFDADQAIDGQRISKELPASVTVLRSVGFAATLGIGTLRQIVAIVVALARESVCGDDLLQYFCGGDVDSARRGFPLPDQP